MNRVAYANWIINVIENGKKRGLYTKLDDFGKEIIHYEMVDNVKVCKCYSRNSISNWKNGNNLPKTRETLISIALYEYDYLNPGGCKSDEQREKRYKYANMKLKEYLGIELYGRCLYDTLLIEVCRGIISFEELLVKEEQYQAEIKEKNLSFQDKIEITRGNPNPTKDMCTDLEVIRSVVDLDEVIVKYINFYRTVDYAFGSRFLEIFKSRNRYKENLALQDAVYVYAPNYRDSYKKIYSYSEITRDWIVDLCLHLRFNREEINRVLNCAHMAELSKDVTDIESLYAVRNNSNSKNESGNVYQIGSIAWYKDLERSGVYSHYSYFSDIELREMVLIILVLALCVEQTDYDDLPPIDYYLESFMLYGYGKKAVISLRELIQKNFHKADEYELSDDVKEKAHMIISDLLEYVNVNSSNAYADWESYKEECSKYFFDNLYEDMKIQSREELGKLRYFAGLVYTVLIGKYYAERSMKDFDQVDERFNKKDQDELRFLYRGIIGVLLDEERIEERGPGKYCVVEANGRINGAVMSWEDIAETLWLDAIELNTQSDVLDKE